MTIGIFVRNPDGSDGEQLDDFLKLDLILRWNDVSTWSVELPKNAKSTQFASAGYGIVIERSDSPTFSGPVTIMEREWEETKDRIIVSGVSDDTYLFRRLAFPSLPVSNGDGTYSFAANAYDVRTDNAETVMHQYVQANAITGGTFATGRAIPGLVLGANEGRGATVTYSARFQTLGEILQALALADTSIGFRVRELIFEIVSPVDLSADVVFSPEMGNLKSFKYSRQAPLANQFYVAGGDEGTARKFVIGGDTDSQDTWGTIESFRDRRDTEDPVELTQTLTEEIADKGEQRGLEVMPIDLPTLSYGTHYNLGDTVTVEIDGEPIVDRLRQINLTYDENGESIAPNVMTPTAQAAAQVLRIYDTVRRLSRRTSALEKAV